MTGVVVSPSVQSAQDAAWNQVVEAMDANWRLWIGPYRTNDQALLDAAWEHYEDTSRAYHNVAGEDC